MTNDGKFVGVMEHLLDDAQAEVWFQLAVFLFKVSKYEFIHSGRTRSPIQRVLIRSSSKFEGRTS